MARFKLDFVFPVAKILRGIEPTTEMMLALGEKQIENIRERLKKGRGIMDLQMRKYAKSTKVARQRKGLQVSVRDLSETGQMLRDMKAQVKGKQVIIGFTTDRSQKLAGYHQAFSVWFGISPRDYRQLIDWMKQYRKARQ